MNRTFYLIVGFISLVLVIAFWVGLFISLNGLPVDYVPDQNALYCFGIGLCALPALILTPPCVHLGIELFKQAKK